MLKSGLGRYLTQAQLSKLGSVNLGIAGAGGLGSNVAMLLARCGIERFFIVDHDNIEPSNLNRQHFLPQHVGRPKAICLKEQLEHLNPGVAVEISLDRLNENALEEIPHHADIWIEALDEGTLKKAFVEASLLANKTVIAASGIAGYGGHPMTKRKLGNLTVVGDFRSSIDTAPPLAPRVMQAAALMADCVLEQILDTKEGQELS